MLVRCPACHAESHVLLELSNGKLECGRCGRYLSKDAVEMVEAPPDANDEHAVTGDLPPKPPSAAAGPPDKPAPHVFVRPVAVARPTRKRDIGIVATGLVALACVALWQIMTGHAVEDAAVAAQGDGRPHPRPSIAAVAPSVATEVRLDASGRPVAVKAPDPESVLSAYCGAASGPVYKIPENVVAAEGGYVGYYREAGIRYALPIRKVTGGYAAESTAATAVSPIAKK
jgi:hypothetical protein